METQGGISMASSGVRRNLTAILCADVKGYSRRLNRVAFCLLLPAILAQWGCENGPAAPDSGIAFSPESVSTENAISLANGVSTARGVSIAATHDLDSCYTATGTAGDFITQLSCPSQGIESLDGIEGLHALTKLELNDNEISDLSPLAHLTRLQSLNLAANRVKDLSPLAALTELTDLILAGNRIDDVAPLAELNRLVVLDLSSNRISDVDDLGVMEGLGYLNLDDNEINNVSSLGHLTSLKSLNLSSNSVTLGVRNLVSLTEAHSIQLLHNDNIACSDLDALEDALAGDVLWRPGACVPY